jgi:hypothetical protein
VSVHPSSPFLHLWRGQAYRRNSLLQVINKSVKDEIGSLKSKASSSKGINLSVDQLAFKGS